MSESFEQQMLQSLKRATEEENFKDQNNEEGDQVIASREKTDL